MVCIFDGAIYISRGDVGVESLSHRYEELWCGILATEAAAVTAIFMPKTSWTWKLEKNAREKSSRRAPRLRA